MLPDGLNLTVKLKKKQWVRGVVLVWAILATPVLLLAATTRMYRVAASSMMPALVEGDRVVVNLMSYDLKVPFTSRRVLRWSAPQVGDIVLFSVPNGSPGYIAFKRVVAVPGDTVEIRDNHLFVNGQTATYEAVDNDAFKQLPSDNFLDHHFESEMIGNQSRVIELASGSPSQKTFGPVSVPPDHYFVLGDYRDNSNDSRTFGLLNRERIEGRIILKAF